MDESLSKHDTVKNPAASDGASSKEKARSEDADLQTSDSHSPPPQAVGFPGFFHMQAPRVRIGRLDARQVAAWRAMTPAERLEIAFQAYQFALHAVRLTERRNHPDLPPDELAWRVTRRMQRDQRLGR